MTRFKPITDDKILDLSKLNAFAADKLNFTRNIKFVFQSAGKGESAVYWHFFSLTMFTIGLFLRGVENGMYEGLTDYFRNYFRSSMTLMYTGFVANIGFVVSINVF